jgi:hypothetical protein
LARWKSWRQSAERRLQVTLGPPRQSPRDSAMSAYTRSALSELVVDSAWRRRHNTAVAHEKASEMADVDGFVAWRAL